MLRKAMFYGSGRSFSNLGFDASYYKLGSYVNFSLVLTLVGCNFRLNCILKQELRRNDPHSRSSKESPFRPLLGALYAEELVDSGSPA